MKTEVKSQKLTREQFGKVSQHIYALCGIKLTAGKEELVQSRLSKRLQALDLQTFDEYLNYVETDKSGREIVQMIDVLTTNKTSFFREIQHFDFLREQILPQLDTEKKQLRIWSAACSSGEEPYSIGILLHEAIPNFASWDARILATDISTEILARAQAACYTNDVLMPVPTALQKRYFTQSNGGWQVADKVRNLVKFARLNLMHDFPMRGPFDVIFCRNVMIYFDKPTQEKLVNRFYELLAPGGHLLVGHAESLIGAKHNFRYVQPAVYLKED